MINGMGAASAVAMIGRPMIPSVAPNLERAARRLYLGKIPADTYEQAIAEFFNNLVLGVPERPHPKTLTPVKGVTIGHQSARVYAFIEFNTLDDAEIGILFDGVVFKEMSLAIRRPKDFMPIPHRIPRKYTISLPDGQGEQVYLGNIPPEVSDEDLKALVQSFGEVIGFYRPEGKKFAFFIYKNPNATTIAVAGLKGLALQGSTLTCELAKNASSGGEPLDAGLPGMTGMAGMAGMTGLGMTGGMGGMGGMGGVGGGLLPLTMNSALTPTTPQGGGALLSMSGALLSMPGVGGVGGSRVVVLLNMVTHSDLGDDNELADVYEDVKDECSKYGKVASLLIPRFSDTVLIGQVGKVFVEYTEAEAARTAAVALAGRRFADRTVTIDFLSEVLYQQYKAAAKPPPAHS